MGIGYAVAPAIPAAATTAATYIRADDVFGDGAQAFTLYAFFIAVIPRPFLSALPLCQPPAVGDDTSLNAPALHR